MKYQNIIKKHVKMICNPSQNMSRNSYRSISVYDVLGKHTHCPPASGEAYGCKRFVVASGEQVDDDLEKAASLPGESLGNDTISIHKWYYLWQRLVNVYIWLHL